MRTSGRVPLRAIIKSPHYKSHYAWIGLVYTPVYAISLILLIIMVIALSSSHTRFSGKGEGAGADLVRLFHCVKRVELRLRELGASTESRSR